VNEQQEQEAQDLHQDHLDRQAEDHVLRHEELHREAMDAYARSTRDFAVALADAVYHKHGNYPAALIDVCSALVMFHGEKAISELVDLVYREKAEEDSSPF